MVKSREDVVAAFNEYVNMDTDELQRWLDDPQSAEAGTGVGVESGRRIVEILKKNPEKDPGKYDEEDLEHMRKVVSYNARHLAQEDKLKETKTKEELENTKSTISLKNWEHDPIKTLDKDEGKKDGSTKKDGEQDGDGAKHNGTAPGASSNEKPNGEEKQSAEAEPAGEGKSGAKRKLGEDGEKSAEPVEEEVSKEVGGYEDGLEDAPEGPADGEERARKRTKTAEEGETAKAQ